MPQQYTELPLDEKPEEEQLAAPVKGSRWTKKTAAWVISVLVLASVVIFAGAGAWTKKTPVEQTPVEEPEWLAHATRAAGDQYLLGVGKADITGYVDRAYKYLWN